MKIKSLIFASNNKQKSFIAHVCVFSENSGLFLKRLRWFLTSCFPTLVLFLKLFWF